MTANLTHWVLPESLKLYESGFRNRLEKLEEYINANYQVEPIPNGWRCTHNNEHSPGVVITPDTVMFVMKNLGF